ncbi:hypothetical protein D3C72_990890 [compost metagenome]
MTKEQFLSKFISYIEPYQDQFSIPYSWEDETAHLKLEPELWKKLSEHQQKELNELIHSLKGKISPESYSE